MILYDLVTVKICKNKKRITDEMDDKKNQKHNKQTNVIKITITTLIIKNDDLR